MELNKKNFTPLHTAALYHSKAMAELLISNGANLYLKEIIYLNIEILFLINII